MASPKRLYETTFVINASLDDTQIDAVIGRVQDLIARNGGVILAVNKWGRKRLAYSINKKSTGFYVNIEFEAPATSQGPLERAYQLDELVLRHLTIILDKKAIASRKAIQAAAALAAADQPPAPPAAAPESPAREPLFTEQAEEKKG
jgi:small subunit ribosomal protein S6